MLNGEVTPKEATASLKEKSRMDEETRGIQHCSYNCILSSFHVGFKSKTFFGSGGGVGMERQVAEGGSRKA